MNLRQLRFLSLACLLVAATRLQAQDTLQQRFMQAVEQRDAKLVKTLLHQGADVNMSVTATAPNYLFFISRELFLKGLAKTRRGESVYVGPIHANADRADVKVLKLLRKKKVNIEAGDSDGKTPLMYALRNPGGEEYALLLLKKGANYRSVDNAGNTVMHYAAYGGNVQGIRMTAGGGVDVNARNTDGITPLHAAAVFSSIPVIQEVVGLGGDIHATDSAGMGVLHYAAAFADSSRLAWLLSQVPEGLAVARNGYTPLDIARTYENEPAIAFLKARGCKYSAYRHEELLAAMQARDHQRLRLILADGADPNHNTGEWPLLLAIQSGDNVSVDLLLAAGARPDVSDTRGTPALSSAIAKGQPSIALSLVKAGAPVPPKSACDCMEQLDKAEATGYWEDLVTALLPKVPSLDRPCAGLRIPLLHYAAYLGREGLVSAILASGARADAPDADGWTALHWAAMKRDHLRLHLERHRIAIALLAGGATVNVPARDAKVLPHAADPLLAQRVPQGATAWDILGYALPQDADLTELLREKGARSGITGAAFLENGRWLMERKLYDAALRDFNNAIAADARLAEAHFYRAQVLAHQKAYLEAEGDLTRAIALKSNYAEAYAARAKARYEIQQLAKAEQDITTAMQLGYSKAEALYWRGKVRLRLDRRDDACADFHESAAMGHSDGINGVKLFCNK